MGKGLFKRRTILFPALLLSLVCLFLCSPLSIMIQSSGYILRRLARSSPAIGRLQAHPCFRYALQRFSTVFRASLPTRLKSWRAAFCTWSMYDAAWDCMSHTAFCVFLTFCVHRKKDYSLQCETGKTRSSIIPHSSFLCYRQMKQVGFVRLSKRLGEWCLILVL